MKLGDTLDTRRAAAYLGRARAGAGLAMLIAPGLIGRGWAGPVGGSAGARLFTRVAGVRELALGLGSTIAVGQQRGGADWVSMLAVCDAGDALVSLFTPGVAKRARLLSLVAAASAVGHFLLAQDLAAAEAATSSSVHSGVASTSEPAPEPA